MSEPAQDPKARPISGSRWYASATAWRQKPEAARDPPPGGSVARRADDDPAGCPRQCGRAAAAVRPLPRRRVNPAFLPVRELAEAVRARQVCAPVGLAETFLDRLEKIGPHYNAVVATRERAITQARSANEIAAGRLPRAASRHSRTAPRICWRRRAASRRRGAPRRSATSASTTTRRSSRKLRGGGRRAGARKLAMVELAGRHGLPTTPTPRSRARASHPWNRTRWSGGSSSGSGSAVAAGLVPFAIGSETWGSIPRRPGHCGVTGGCGRPTAASAATARWRSAGRSTSWARSRLTADDCGLVLEAIAGADPDDPSTTATATVALRGGRVTGRRVPRSA